jgi:hypothetical protein
MKAIDLIGQRFGRLTVLGRAENNKHGKAQWTCECDCGSLKRVCGRNLMGATRVVAAAPVFGTVMADGTVGAERRKNTIRGWV